MDIPDVAPQADEGFDEAAQPLNLIPGIEFCRTIDGLGRIKNPETELVVWQRERPPQFHDWLDGIAPSVLPHLRILVEPGRHRRALEPMLDEFGLPAGDMRDFLVADVDALVRAFADITGSDLVDVRLEKISHDACWKFHRDTVETRLLSTYRGPTTQWVKPKDADQALREQKGFKGPLERFRLHDVAIFKGCSLDPGRGIVHRSPPIEGTGQTRLVLCLNKRTEVSPAPWRDI